MATPSELFSFEVDRASLPRGMGVLGGGTVGGKARGLLFAARLLERDRALLAGPYAGMLHLPRTIAIGSEVFEEFMADNGLWDLVGRVSFEELQRRFLAGSFQAPRRQQFSELLAHMRYPLAIRSSSALEDSADHSFAGIYLTMFISNRGTPDERLAACENAVRSVFASTYNDNAMAYRGKRRLRDADERMGVVVQRMIGRVHEHLMYPALAGVAFSRNFYPWSPSIRRDEGLMRLVFGLGTRAVGRNYARVVSLSHPGLRPEGHVIADIRRYSQEVFDALNLRTGALDSLRVHAISGLDPDLRSLCSVARGGGDYLLDGVMMPQLGDQLVLTFNELLRTGRPLPLVDLMRTLLHSLETACGLPVDVEFAVTLPRAGTPRRAGFHLLQLRPLGVRAPHQRIDWPDPPREQLLLSGRRTMGNGLWRNIRHVVYVRPERYLSEPVSSTVTRVAELNRRLGAEGYMLVGPGRWGTRNEKLGVPVLYGHICNARALVEVSLAEFTPELSYGTHFFGDLFAEDVPYIPVFPENRDVFNHEWFETTPGHDEGDVVRWIQVPDGITLAVDGTASRAIVFLQDGPPPAAST